MLRTEQLKLIRFLDTNISKQRYGSMTLTVILKDGIPLVQSARIVKMKRKKYKVSKPLDTPLKP